MATTKKVTEEPVVETEEYLNEMITIRLPIIPGKEKQEALYVGVNGKSWVVPRGVDFELPRYAYKVIENAENEALEAYRYQQDKLYRN